MPAAERRVWSGAGAIRTGHEKLPPRWCSCRYLSEGPVSTEFCRSNRGFKHMGLQNADRSAIGNVFRIRVVPRVKNSPLRGPCPQVVE
jgi:hypothetical protein